MKNTKKRDRPLGEQVSPPPKMAKNPSATGQPSNLDLMTQLTILVESNTGMIKKIDALEKRLSLFEKLFEEVEYLKKEVERLSKQNRSSVNDGFRRFEVEQKKKSILVKGLPSMTTKKFETRQETYDRVNELFQHVGLNLTLEDYQRLGQIKPEGTMVRLQFWTRDDKSMLFAKFKEYSDDPVIKRISLINDYPSFQLADVKKLSDESYKLRQKDKALKTRIVPRGLEVRLQTRKGTGKWMLVSPQNGEDQTLDMGVEM
jgi:hypothetical protein